MKKRLYAADQWIQDRCKELAHSFQRMTGKTSLFLAKIGGFICFLSATMIILDYFFKLTIYSPPLYVALIYVTIAFSTAHDGKICDEAEKAFLEDPTVLPKELKYLRRGILRLPFFKLIWFMILCYDLVLFVVVLWKFKNPVVELIEDVFFPFGMLVFAYFIMVDPLPPSKSKAKEWLESFRQRLVQVPVERG